MKGAGSEWGMHQEVGYCLPSGVRTHIVDTCNNRVQLFLLVCGGGAVEGRRSGVKKCQHFTTIGHGASQMNVVGG